MQIVILSLPIGVLIFVRINLIEIKVSLNALKKIIYTASEQTEPTIILTAEVAKGWKIQPS